MNLSVVSTFLELGCFIQYNGVSCSICLIANFTASFVFTAV